MELIENQEYGYCCLITATQRILDRLTAENTVYAKIEYKGRKEVEMIDSKALKEAVDNLAKKDISGSYVNYLNSSYNNSAATYVNMSNIPNSIITTYTNNAAYTDYSETTSYID